MSRPSIVWVESPELHRYVRESVIFHPRRRARPGRRYVPGGGTLVAYSALPEDAVSFDAGRYFLRKVWWLADRDLNPAGPYSAGGQPCEAVDPMRLAAEGCQ